MRLDGAAPSVMTEARIALDDGSRIELDPGSRLETIENGPTRFSTLLARGRARFSVRPGGRRRWVVEGGLATIEVVGTVFVVERGDEGVRVSVERGVVIVRGERVPDRVRRLTAGESIFIPRQAPVAAAAPVEPVPAHLPERAQAPPGRTAPEQTEDELDALQRRADTARRRGDVGSAIALLRRAMASAEPGDPRTAIVLFTIGRLEMDARHDTARAREAFERALALGRPEHLEPQARRRLEEIADLEEGGAAP
jgi:transmembrane sensor